MNQTEIKREQRIIGVEQDGFWGPVSTAAAKSHLRKMMPSGRFPTQRQVRSGRSIFGRHGEPDGSYSPPTRKITLPFELHLYGEETSPRIRTISPHEKCADAMLSAFQRLDQEIPKDERKASGILDYYGVYNPRSTRGGSVWSMHAWAIAIDLDATRNKNGSHWPVRSKMSIRVYECFAKEGFLCAGPFWSRDGMHMQSTSS